ncbi:hypothetical protein N826_36515 [Skermanella aerolata KACC 11604]|nr:hypothetical protein N826_36515 [Skermanella aerolata KACC 11604]
MSSEINQNIDFVGPNHCGKCVVANTSRPAPAIGILAQSGGEIVLDQSV